MVGAHGVGVLSGPALDRVQAGEDFDIGGVVAVAHAARIPEIRTLKISADGDRNPRSSPASRAIVRCIKRLNAGYSAASRESAGRLRASLGATRCREVERHGTTPGDFRMRPSILVVAIAALWISSFASAHGRHGGNAHANLSGKSSSTPAYSNDNAASVSGDNKSDAKPNADAFASRDADTSKPHRKPARAPDEEEVMQAEH
jgi:hypothetical protein